MSANQPRRRPDRMLDDAPPTQQCSFCLEKPTGLSGHAGLALHVHKIPPTIRTHVRLTCSFCGTHWARRRVSAKTFEWRRLVD